MKDKNRITGLCLIVVIILGIIDFSTGYDFGFFVFYFFPVLVAGYYAGFKNSAILSLSATLMWFLSDIITEHEYSHEIFRYWNSLIRLVAFLLVGYIISLNRKMLDKEKELSDKLEKTLSEVKQLSGLLPICASCKNIRNDKGYWEQIEVYVKDHSDANFSHSICPVCMEKLYPDVIQKRKDKLAAAEKHETPK